jgi:hypothetical protein
MALVSPRIVGPISTLSTAVRINGHGPDAVVEVVAITGAGERLVARDTPSGAFDGYIYVAAGSLREGDWLATRQTDATGDKSALLAQSERVQVLMEPTPADATPVSVLTHASTCAECLYVDGVYPGAEVSIRDASGGLRGATLAIGTVARLECLPGLDGPGFTVQQRVGPFVGPPTTIGEPDFPFPLRPKRPPAPRIVEPVGACANAIGIEGVIGGATVRVRRQKRRQLLWDEDARCVDTPRVAWPVAALEKGDVLWVTQALCGAESEAHKVVVGDELVRTPWILPPCERDDRVLVFELELGAEVEIAVDTDDAASSPRSVRFRGFAYASVCAFALPAGTLRRGATVFARQRLCDTERQSSAVEVRPGRQTEPTIDGSLRACATRVRVRNIVPGSTVKLISENHRARGLEGCIGTAIALPGDPFVDVPCLALQVNDTVWPVVISCGKVSEGRAEGVFPVYDVGAPHLEPVTTCGRIVVTDVIAGATVEVFVDGRHAGGPYPSPTTVCSFPRPSFLALGSSVYARQRACGRMSPRSNMQSATAGKLALVETKRIQQITGDLARVESPAGFFEIGRNRTDSRYGLIGMDLGVVVEHAGEQVLLFGDSMVNRQPPLLRPIGLVREYPVDLDDGLSLDFLEERLPDGRRKLIPLGVIDAPDPATGDRGSERHDPANPAVHDEGFFVPTGAFSYDGKLYVFVMESVRIRATEFFWTGQRSDAAKRETDQKTWEAGNYGAPEGRVIGGRTILASSRSLAGPFTREATLVDIRDLPFEDFPVRWRFSHVVATVVELAKFPVLGATGDGLFIWGAGAYRQGDVSFAWTRLERGKPVPPPASWSYFVGTDASGNPLFSNDMDRAIGMMEWSSTGTLTTVVSYRPVPKAEPATERLFPPRHEIGEFSVTYVAELSSWLFLYRGVHAYLASTPWGPWQPSNPGVHVLDDSTVITANIRGGSGMYGPYVLPRYTRWDETTLSVQLYFLGSHFDAKIDPHGQVHLFRTNLRCVPA